MTSDADTTLLSCPHTYGIGVAFIDTVPFRDA